ncbi:MAG: methyltransferase domain-containing protein [Gordonia sp. (in: high G+C Gram-positive bacteria)]|uniref:methyltransferase domain-containing protein n=1 Tax=Gordonia sp. (in: high G+C Gram-positive bacteria) TaxID=84139 RepID=UPI0039E48579
MCRDRLAVDGRTLICPLGHRFDLARQGYAPLLSGRGRAHRSDTAPMVAARRRILDAGVFAAVQRELAAHTDPASSSIVDAGAGTGHYLASVLDAAPEAHGIGIDLSKYCARACARASERAISVVADLWEGLPVRSGTADAVLSVFAPRNLAETARILAPGGRWLIVTPNPGHLHQVREELGMLRIGAEKLERLHRDLAGGGFVVNAAVPVVSTVVLTAARLADLAGMGPAGHHRTESELAAAAAHVAGAAGEHPVTLDVTLTVAHVDRPHDRS